MTAKDTSTTPLWLQVLHSAQRVETRFEDELSGVGLSISKLGVLRILVDEGQPMPLSRLAGKLSCVKSNVTQLVDRLEADGLVARINDPADRRSVLASIT
ncbi:MAG TPA: MarR family transcriptional regulator, partial [Blastocatellia bacterium]|nr:MarR family transcriptional regulator [Blastocatellia bacterium]